MKVRAWNDESNSFVSAKLIELENMTLVDERGFDLSWFTGNHDFLGTEIYSGDIVQSDYYWPDIKCVAAIKYNTGSMSFVADDGEQDAYKYGSLTVIGNIHQNPELLEAKS